MSFSKWNSKNRGHLLGGKVKAIAVTYHEGIHACRNLTQARSVIRELMDLHNEGFVHGDIRGFNMVFSENTDRAFLIDFDFGGKLTVDDSKYPRSYKDGLPGGRRMGSAGESITKEYDVHDLAYALGTLHELQHLDIKDQASLELGGWFYRMEKSRGLKRMTECLTEREQAGVVRFCASDWYRYHK